MPKADWTTVTGAAVTAGGRGGQLQPDGLRSAVERERPLDRAACGGGDDPGGAEGGRRRAAAAKDLAHGRLDVPAIGVGQRAGAAGPSRTASEPRSRLCRHRGRRRVIAGDGDVGRPAGDVDRQIVADPGGQPGPGRLDNDAPGVRPEPVGTCGCSHRPTVSAPQRGVYPQSRPDAARAAAYQAQASGERDVAEELVDAAKVAQSRLRWRRPPSG